jgi:hypothetical protein
LVPIIGTLTAMYVMKNYDLTENRAIEIAKILKNRKTNK